MKKEGVVGLVSRYNNIRFENDETWYKPVGDAEKVVSRDLIGKTVTLTLKEGDDRAFTFIAIPSGSQKPVNTSAPTDRDTKILKQYALREAREYIALAAQCGYVGFKDASESAEATPLTYMEQAKEIANHIMEWVNK